MFKKIIGGVAVVALLGIGIAVSQETPASDPAASTTASSPTTTASPTPAPAKKPTADRHKDRGLNCGVCHNGEEAPTTATTSQSCLMCHESLTAVAEKTKAYNVNPHDNHITATQDLDCLQCHQGHKDDTVVCYGCHAGMKFK